MIRSLPINQCSGSAVASPADAFRVWGLELRTCGLREVGPKCEQDVWRKLSMDHGFLFSRCIPTAIRVIITKTETWANTSPLVLFLIGIYSALEWVIE